MATPKKKAANKNFTFILVAVAIIGAGLLGWVSMRGSRGVEIDPNMPMGTARGFLIGSPDAPVKLKEFADFECPGCAQFATLAEPDLRARYFNTGKASLEFYVFPLPMHKNTWAASNAAYCAAEQGKFWEMHDRLFYTQDLWNGTATANPDGKMMGYAKDIALDAGKFESCYESKRNFPDIKASGAEAERLGITGTPTIIIGGRKYDENLSFDFVKGLIEAELAKLPATDAAKKDK